MKPLILIIAVSLTTNAYALRPQHHSFEREQCINDLVEEVEEREEHKELEGEDESN